MFASLVLMLAATFAESKAMAVQIHLDRAGYSCSAIDGVWGKKSNHALTRYMLDHGLLAKGEKFPGPDEAFDRFFATKSDPFKIVEVTQADLDAIVKIPEDAAAKSVLPRMGYESLVEMFAERGHLSQKAFERLNPGIDWKRVKPGLKLVIPDFPSVDEELLAGDRNKKDRPYRPEAALVEVSLKGWVTARDANGKLLLLAPCSIAADKAKVPQSGELTVKDYIPWPNYTYTPDFTPPGEKVKRYILPPGENSPVGVAWLGLSLPTYGIHGTPRPESIGYTGSHGCFRLANWNAARLYALCRVGTRVRIEP